MGAGVGVGVGVREGTESDRPDRTGLGRLGWAGCWLLGLGGGGGRPIRLDWAGLGWEQITGDTRGEGGAHGVCD